MKVHFMPERAPPHFRQVISAEQAAGHTVLVVLPRATVASQSKPQRSETTGNRRVFHF